MNLLHEFLGNDRNAKVYYRPHHNDYMVVVVSQSDGKIHAQPFTTEQAAENYAEDCVL